MKEALNDNKEIKNLVSELEKINQQPFIELCNSPVNPVNNVALSERIKLALANYPFCYRIARYGFKMFNFFYRRLKKVKMQQETKQPENQYIHDVEKEVDYLSDQKDFYYFLENKFRGTKADISNRLAFYLPILNQYFPQNKKIKIVDLASGRGEWLELLLQKGYDDILGVEINKTVAEASSTFSMGKVTIADIFSFLPSLNDESVNVITSFHFIEHIDFDSQQTILREAHRILAKGGILILETPNIACPFVSSESFWLDPTHNKPIPEKLLRFMFEYAGFEALTSCFINPLEDESVLRTIQSYYPSTNMIETISQNYAIIGRK